jgi:hypothetical protein
MGWKKFRKKLRKTVKRVGKQIKRSTAVAAPALLGPGLGEKVGVSIAKTAGKTAIKSTYKRMGQVSNVTGRVVQVAGTAIATWFGGPILGSMAYRGTALMRQIGQKEIQEGKFKAGLTTTRGHKIVWKKQPVRILEAAAAGLGGAIVGAAAGGTSIFASGSSMITGAFGGGGVAAGGTGASAAMQSSTAAMVAGETGGAAAATTAAAAAGGTGVLGYVAPALGLAGLASRFLGGGAAPSGGTIMEGGITEVYSGEGGVLGAEGPLGPDGLGLVSEDGSFLGTGIPMLIVVVVLLAAVAYWYFA